VLVTAGTSVRDPDLLAGLVISVADAGYQVAVTVEPGRLPENPRVHAAGFVPLARLLPAVDAVVGTAGLGTVLATLATGLPSVLRPVLADQPWNAQRVVAAGAGIFIQDPAEAGPAVRSVLSNAAYRAAAQAAATSIGSMPSPAAALDELLIRAGLPARA
jgi:UDP:flavonoid glycosyltransferase YjiC (YdhE family)